MITTRFMIYIGDGRFPEIPIELCIYDQCENGIEVDAMIQLCAEVVVGPFVASVFSRKKVVLD